MPARSKLFRPSMQKFRAYQAGKPIEEVQRELGLEHVAKMASNENPLGTSPKAKNALQEAIDDVWLYPDDNSHYFRQKVANLFDVRMEQVMAAAGSVEVLELVASTMLTEKDALLTSEHTFAIYTLAPEKFGAEVRYAPMTDGGYRYDLEAIADLIDEKVKVIALANPTNPTGTWFTRDEFERFLERVPEDVLIIYDSAYEEYTDEEDMPDPMAAFRQGRQILYIRTMSKAYGLAGVRVGFAIGPEEIIDGLRAAQYPFSVNLLAQRAGIAALDDHEFVKQSREFNRRELEFLRKSLEDLDVTIPPSRANFLLIDTNKDAKWLFVELQKRGFIVRPMGGYGLPNAIRVSPVLHEDNEKFVENLRELLSS